MVKIFTKPGRSRFGHTDRAVWVDSKKPSFATVREQTLRLVNKHGAKAVKKAYGIPHYNHRSPKKDANWTLKEAAKIFKLLCKNEDRRFPKSKGFKGSEYTKMRISKWIHTHLLSKKK